MRLLLALLLLPPPPPPLLRDGTRARLTRKFQTCCLAAMYLYRISLDPTMHRELNGRMARGKRRCFVFGQYMDGVSQCPLSICSSSQVSSIGYKLGEGGMNKNEIRGSLIFSFLFFCCAVEHRLITGPAESFASCEHSKHPEPRCRLAVAVLPLLLPLPT